MQDIYTLDLTGPALDWVIANLLNREAVYRLHQNSIGATVYRTEGLRQAGISFAPSNPGVTYAKDVWPILTNPCIVSIDRSECTGIWTVIARDAEALWSASSLILNEAICRAFACAKLGSIASIPDDLLAASAR